MIFLLAMMRFRRSIIFLTGLLAVALCCSLNPARAEYRLQGGDVVEISVSGVPELRQRAPVQLDGSVTFPVVGTFMVEGVEFSEIRTKLQSAVASKIFRIRTPDGKEISRMFERDEVAATIVEYRPVFVTGDVTRPGEQAFRPRMTARQALASAGGFSALARANATSFDAANLRSEYITDWLTLAREHARVWRIKTELGENIELDQKAIPPAPVPDTTISQIVNLEIQYRTASSSDHERQKDFLRRSIQEADQQALVLSEQKQNEDEGVQADSQEFQKARAAFGNGSLPSFRVAEFRRAVLYSSTRQLQTTNQLMQVKKSRAEFARELEKIDDQRQIRLLAELQDATVKLAGERAKLRSAEEKLQLAGLRPPRSSDGASKADITLFRSGMNGKERLTADADTELQPGDVIEVALRPEGVDIAAQ
ncbi:MAG TPA: polysaccharide biosynthesis/export family protein [Gemmatimonadaceae bacterium]|nr:polysaccharide biosynthesis/export family protein [Gemmatimonadaceae bacterium]